MDIYEEFVRICRTGTSKDCRIFVQEASRKGISYEQLCEYKREKENDDEFHARANRLADPGALIKGIDW